MNNKTEGSPVQSVNGEGGQVVLSLAPDRSAAPLLLLMLGCVGAALGVAWLAQEVDAERARLTAAARAAALAECPAPPEPVCSDGGE